MISQAVSFDIKYAAHEIKNCAALALANVGLIRLSDENRIMDVYCARIERSIQQINALVMEMMKSGDVGDRQDSCQTDEGTALSKGQIRGQHRGEPACDIGEVLTEMVEEYRSAFPHISFSSPSIREWQSASCGALSVRIIFSNMLKNAAEAAMSNSRPASRLPITETSGSLGWVNITATSEEEEITIKVHDSGSGLGAGELARAAERGYTTKEGGSGFGLAACLETARRCGGRFTLANHPQGGCEASVTLPATR